MITLSNNLKFNNFSTTNYNKIVVFPNKIQFDDNKVLELKNDNRIYYNGYPIYYECKEGCNLCTSCNSTTSCSSKCNSCVDGCNGLCVSCNSCVDCHTGCQACTNCDACHECTSCRSCNNCQGCNCECVASHGNCSHACQGTGCGAGTSCANSTT